MELQRGFRGNIENVLNIMQPFQVKISTVGNDVYDTCCFGLDEKEKLSDERYTIFYNQTNSPFNEISYRENDCYNITLGALPEKIAKLVFTVSIDGNGTMGNIRSHSVQITQNGKSVFEFSLNGEDFKTEKAIIDLEFYHKNVWRIAVVARGFNGGLDKILESYGGEVIDSAQSQQPAKPEPIISAEEQFTGKIMNKISLSKDKANLEKHVVNLSKCVVNLIKKSGVNLGNTSAKVFAVLDYSGSMRTLYRNGTVQQTLNKLIPLGLTFDDNGSIDFYLFETKYRKMDDLNLSNYENYVEDVILSSGYHMGQTNYAPVLKDIIENDVSADDIPTFILFITDGANADKRETNSVIKKSSEMNVFIQFIGIGNSEFDYLERLDDLPGRKRDNTGFSRMTDLMSVSDEKLYTYALEQFSQWLKGLQ